MRDQQWNPNIGPWLKEQRRVRGWKQDMVVERLAEAGHRVGRSWLSRVENGTPFSDDLFAAFCALYGSVPPPAPEERDERPSGSEASELVEAIGALVGRIDLLIANQATASTEMMKALGALGSALIPRGKRGGGGPGTPSGVPR